MFGSKSASKARTTAFVACAPPRRRQRHYFATLPITISAQKFYFFLLPRYWLGAATTATDSARACGRAEFSDSPTARPPTSGTVGVVVEGVRKQYGDCEALKGVSMEMECGEMTALLGHNGAGKTTLSHILSCEVYPTAGDVRVFGHSVTQDPYSVRQLVGLCKQDDYLYPNLSAREHLVLFAGLRGVRSSVLAETVSNWLESVDLSLVQNHYTSSFSGGMKRRLSVALATIGGKPLIILDEPTTGMDPVSRRFVWKHIDEIKKGRVVLLTTHAMEEADLLSDMVAVMRKGELAALGTPLQLKAAHGSAIQFLLIVDREHVLATKEAKLDRFASSKEWVAVDAGYSGNITVNITQIRQGENSEGVDVKLLADFVAWLEKKESGVAEYGFSNSSLEEVFLKLTEGDKDEARARREETEELDHTDVCCSFCCRSFLLCCLRGPCRCCCCPRPRQEPEAGADEELQELNLVAANGEEDSEEITFKPVLTVQRQSWAIIAFYFTRSWSGSRSIGSWIMYSLLLMGVVIIGLSAGGFYDPNPAMTLPTAAISLLLVSLVSPIYLDRKHGSFYLMKAQGLLKRSFLLGQGLYAFSVALIFSFVVLSAFYATPLFREPIICEACDDYYNCSDCPWFSFGSRRIVTATSVYWWEDTYNNEPVSLYATFTAGSFGRILGAAIMFSLTTPGAVFASSYIPGIKIGLVIVAFVCLTASILPLVIYFIRIREPEEAIQCSWNVCNTTLDSFNINTVGSIGSEFLNCIGLDVNVASLGGLCIPPGAAVLPQFGLFQMLSMTLMSDLILISDPPEYMEQVLIPKIGGNAQCSGNACQFPFARKLYGQNVGFMFLGAAVLLLIGFIQLSLISFPGAQVLWAKHKICGWGRCNKTGHDLEQSGTTNVNEEAVRETWSD